MVGGLGHGRGLGPWSLGSWSLGSWSLGSWSVRPLIWNMVGGYGRGYILGLSRGS